MRSFPRGGSRRIAFRRGLAFLRLFLGRLMRGFHRYCWRFGLPASSLLLAFTCSMWVRSYYVWEGILSPMTQNRRTFSAHSNMGRIHFGMVMPVIARKDGLELPRRNHWQYYRPGPRAQPTPEVPETPGSKHWRFAGVQVSRTVPTRDADGRTIFSSSVLGVSLPWWYLSVFSAIAPTVWLIKYNRGRLRRAPGHCPTCGYDLRATPDRCPECGFTIAPPAIENPAKLST
jgi:hypothetical protein